MITFDSGEKYEFHWCGMKKRKEAGAEFLMPVDSNIAVNETNVSDPYIIATNPKIHEFNNRLMNVYSLAESDSSEIRIHLTDFK